ncbi:Haloacid dehalogenase-like hydrolase-domain-containing protein [Podospora didyma]|uniref:Haloacid dehalogenase-like hydrolase-domain-containing protein n=1 Tax=Podospora didyma TaxID=330526 RepID=A0AAE0P5M4_9PEZI|nr:Haloacid dehalogenase-like hydrolase-domain-containing protein [Podospora didyma]
MATHLDLTSFKALSFDCYGTLIDWEGGMAADLSPITSHLPSSHPWRSNSQLAVERFNALSEHQEVLHPTQSYDENLASTFTALAQEAGIPSSEIPNLKNEVGSGPGRWPAFPDTVAGLVKLSKHYKLIILSNVNEANIKRAVAESLAPAKFEAVYTAEAIGSYKPSHNNFRYLFQHAKEDLGVDFERGDLLHVAHSLTADHVPAKELRFRSVWIARGAEVEGQEGTAGNVRELRAQGKLGFEWHFATIGDFADEVERQFAAKK